MPSAREDDAQTIAALERVIHEARCEIEALREEIEYREAKIRALQRAVDRLA